MQLLFQFLLHASTLSDYDWRILVHMLHTLTLACTPGTDFGDMSSTCGTTKSLCTTEDTTEMFSLSVHEKSL